PNLKRAHRASSTASVSVSELRFSQLTCLPSPSPPPRHRSRSPPPPS
uniref:Uncharacterized protein n=1 Tax=Aegilops tauschii subsp. strangulata TaxID=200361 RepID=A0A453CL33_AEGTS